MACFLLTDQVEATARQQQFRQETGRRSGFGKMKTKLSDGYRVSYTMCCVSLVGIDVLTLKSGILR